jgi:hypothetical protein
MKPSVVTIVVLSLVAAASVAIAGGSITGADPSQAFEVSGTVTAVSIGSGSGMPMLTVDDVVLGLVDVALGPIWFLQEAGFSAEIGDSVDLLAYPCTTCAATAVAAWVENLTNGTSVDLRDEDGRPFWTQRMFHRSGSARPGQGGGSGGQTGGGQSGGQGGGSGTGNGSGTGTGEPGGSGNGTGSGPANGSGLDMSQLATVRGDVVDLTGHAGEGQPVLTLDVDGRTIAIVVSPYQPILAAGLVIEPGLTLTVTFAPTDCDEDPQNVAISIVDDATGVLIQLRDPETGFPMAGGGSGHSHPNWP